MPEDVRSALSAAAAYRRDGSLLDSCKAANEGALTGDEEARALA